MIGDAKEQLLTGLSGAMSWKSWMAMGTNCLSPVTKKRPIGAHTCIRPRHYESANLLSFFIFYFLNIKRYISFKLDECTNYNLKFFFVGRFSE